MSHRTLRIVPRAFGFAWSIGLLFAPQAMNAQLDRSNPPEPGPAPEVQLGEHATITLPNGMHVIVVEDHKLPMVSVQVRFDVPPIAQRDKAGYIDMVGDLLLAGTTTRTKAQLDTTVDALGASLFASNDGVYASALKKNLGPLMELVQDVVVNPVFPDDELEKLRLRYRSSVQQRKEDPEAIAEVVGRSVTFGRTHPYGEIMTEKSVSRIDRASVEAYHRHFFRPSEGYLVFVGDITEKEARDLAKKHFAKWKPASSGASTDENGRTVVPGIGPLYPLEKAATPSGVRRIFLVDRPGAAQSVIRVSFPLGLQPKDIRAQQGQVMNTLLGGGVFNARLMQNLREQRAYTYGAYSTLDVDRFNSSFTASTSVRTEVTDSAVIEILAEMDRMRNEPVTVEELDLAKKYMMGSFGRSLEDPKTVARFALNTELNGLAVDHYRSYLTRLESITAEQVQSAAEAFLHPDQAIVLVVGDKERIIGGLAPISQETMLPVTQLTVDGERWVEEITPVRNLTGDQVLDMYLQAIGGSEALAQLRHLQLEWQVGAPVDERTESQWFAPDQYRMRKLHKATMIEEVTFDGARVLYTTPDVSGELTDAGLEQVRLHGRPVPETAFKALLDKRALLGSTGSGERMLYKVAFQAPSGMSFSTYFNVVTGLKDRTTEEVMLNGRTYLRTTELADWRPINGVLFPHTVIEQGGPEGRVVRTMTKVTANEAMPATFFEVNIPEMPDDAVPPEMLPPEYGAPLKEE